MKAKEVRLISEKAIEKQNSLQFILDRIESRAQYGSYSLSGLDLLYPNNRGSELILNHEEELKSLGYTVRNTSFYNNVGKDPSVPVEPPGREVYSVYW